MGQVFPPDFGVVLPVHGQNKTAYLAYAHNLLLFILYVHANTIFKRSSCGRWPDCISSNGACQSYLQEPGRSGNGHFPG